VYLFEIFNVGMDRLSNPPKPGFMNSLRSTGHTLEEAFEELIDNSITAYAKNIWINYEGFGTPDFIITISDDGKGMNEQGIVESMNLGVVNSTTERQQNDLGRYGLGLKTSSLSQCRKFSVLSKSENSSLRGWTWDLDVLNKSNKWEMIKPSEHNYENAINYINSKPSGTIVIWENIDNELLKATKDETIADIWIRSINHIRMTFGKFMTDRRNINIWLNGEKILPWDPFASDISEMVIAEDNPMESIIKISGFVLPHRKKLTDEQIEDYKGPKGWNAQQGFYLYRNKRLIVSGEWFGLYQQEEHYKLARIQIDIDNVSDSEWGLDFKKTKVIPSEAIKEELKRIADIVRTRAQEVYRYRATRSRRSPQRDFHSVWKLSINDDIPELLIDRKNKFIESALKEDNDGTIKNLLRLLEEYIPLSDLYVNAKYLEYARLPFEQAKDEVTQLIKKMIERYKSQGIKEEKIKRELMLNPPGSEYPEIIEAELEKGFD